VTDGPYKPTTDRDRVWALAPTIARYIESHIDEAATYRDEEREAWREVWTELATLTRVDVAAYLADIATTRQDALAPPPDPAKVRRAEVAEKLKALAPRVCIVCSREFNPRAPEHTKCNHPECVDPPLEGVVAVVPDPATTPNAVDVYPELSRSPLAGSTRSRLTAAFGAPIVYPRGEDK
jgi:hypothetical protein